MQNYAPFLHNVDGADHARTFRVTDAGTNNVSVAAGRVRIDQVVTNFAAPTALGPLANGTNYIYISNAAVITALLAGPYPANSVPLARVVVAGGDVTGITDDRCFFYEDTAAGGAGEANTASSAGAGLSLFFQKVLVDLEFNGIKSENASLGVALDGATHDIELTVARATAGETTTGTDADKVVTPSVLPLQIQNSKWVYWPDTGAADAYVITPAPAIAAYAAGQVFRFKATNANTGASTINVNGKGVRPIKKNYNVALAANDIKVNQIVTIVYDSVNTAFQMVSHLGNVGVGGGYDTIEDEGGALPQRTTIDFVGAGVTAADVGGETRVTIPGGGAGLDPITLWWIDGFMGA